jgi:hypothetical protein
MSDTESNSEYPTLPVNLFNQIVEYEDLPKQLPTTLINPFETPLPFNQGKKGMDPGGSSSVDVFSFSTPVDKKTPVNVKLNSIGQTYGTGHP